MLERHSNQFAELFCISKLLSVKDTNSSSTSRESHVIHSTVVRALHDFTSYYYSYKVHSKCSGLCIFILQSLAHTQAKSGKAWIATSVGSATNKTHDKNIFRFDFRVHLGTRNTEVLSKTNSPVSFAVHIKWIQNNSFLWRIHFCLIKMFPADSKRHCTE